MINSALHAAEAEGSTGQASGHDASGLLPVVSPVAPTSIADTGLSPAFLMELVLKVIRYAGTARAADIARGIRLPPSLTEKLLALCMKEHLCEVMASVPGGVPSSYRYRLTDKGERRVEEALARCRYAGPAPVTLEQYCEIARAENWQRWRPSPRSVENALGSLVLDSEVRDLLRRALGSGRPAMIFGPSGTGKSHLLSALSRHLEGAVWVPYAIYAHGQIIRMFDARVHVPVQDSDDLSPENGADEQPSALGRMDRTDRRWVRVRRPVIMVGGELSSESLELGYDPVVRFYQAPVHLKAQGGILVVDDFGRQRVDPKTLLNRWVMALESQEDSLLLKTGESIRVPFCVTLLFSTNLAPASLADAAYLRRIPYKVHMPYPGFDQLREILRCACEEYGIQYTPEMLEQATQFIWDATSGRPSGSLPRDLASIIVDNAELDGVTPTLSLDALSLASRQFYLGLSQESA